MIAGKSVEIRYSVHNMKITITGLGGTGTSTVGKLLAEILDYKFLSGGDMQRMIAQEMGLTLYEFDEYLKEHSEQDRLVEDRQIAFGKENKDFVLESLLSWYAVPDAFKVLLTCDFDTRIQRVADRENIPFEEAKQKNIARVDTYDDRYGKLYGITKIDEEKNFDMVIDTTNILPEEIVGKIVNKLKLNS